VTDQRPPTNALIDQLTWRLSPEGRKILERVEAMVPTAETDPAGLEPAIALIESLLDEEDRRTIYRIMGLKARAYRQRGPRHHVPTWRAGEPELSGRLSHRGRLWTLLHIVLFSPKF
jgi:hypothetical protein